MNANPSAALPPAKPRWGFRFSLSTLLLLMLAVAVYLGGRASVTHQYALAPKLAGNWQATLPAGFVQPTKVQPLGDGHYLIRSQASIFNGKYQWRKGQLVVVEPADDRMIGLVWKWDGTSLTLIEEPKNHPTGASYVGTVLTTTPPKSAP